jgi:hypothetical protein
MALASFYLPQFEMRVDSGTMVVRDGVVVTFFMPVSHAEVAPAVRAAIDLYLGLPDVPHAFWLLDSEGYPQRHEAPQLTARLNDALLGPAAECDLWIADMSNDAPRFRVRYHGLDLQRRFEEGWPSATSGLSFTLPTDYRGEAGLVEVFSFANEVAREVPFSFGLVSPAFVQAEGALESAAFAFIRGLSRRYRCFEIPALLPDCFECAGAAKGAYWGNYFGATLLANLGHEPGLRAAFAGTEIRFEALGPDKLSVYLDATPIAGDANRQEDVSKYRKALHVVRDMLPRRELTYIGFDDERFSAWTHRFDEGGL